MFKRINLIVKAKVAKMIDDNNDHTMVLDTSYAQQVASLQNMKRSLTVLVMSKKRIERQRDILHAKYTELETAARNALIAGDEPLARRELERRFNIKHDLDTLNVQLAELETNLDQMVANEQKLGSRVSAFGTRKQILAAQYSAAEARVRITEATNGLELGR